jgi:hypothetical protein
MWARGKKTKKKYSQLAVHSNPSLPLFKAAQQRRAVSRTADTYRIAMTVECLGHDDPFQEDRNPMVEMNKIEMTKVLEYWAIT